MEGDGFNKGKVLPGQRTPDIAFLAEVPGLYRFEAMTLPQVWCLETLALVPVWLKRSTTRPIVSVSIAGTSPTKVQDLSGRIAGMFELSKLSIENPRDARAAFAPRPDWTGRYQELRYDALCTAKQVADRLP